FNGRMKRNYLLALCEREPTKLLTLFSNNINATIWKKIKILAKSKIIGQEKQCSLVFHVFNETQSCNFLEIKEYCCLISVNKACNSTFTRLMTKDCTIGLYSQNLLQKMIGKHTTNNLYVV